VMEILVSAILPPQKCVATLTCIPEMRSSMTKGIESNFFTGLSIPHG